MKHTQALFIFRRDLRIDDNTALIRAINEADSIILAFIFDPRQISNKNIYKSDNALQFMLESLEDLQTQCNKLDAQLHYFHGIAHEVVDFLLKSKKFDAVYTNKDYTPFSLERDEKIAHVCHEHKVEFIQESDLMLNEPEVIKTGNGDPYSIFTPYFKNASQHKVRQPETIKTISSTNSKLPQEVGSSFFDTVLIQKNKNIYVHGGRKKGLKILNSLSRCKDYATTHDYPAIDTTLLASHIKFGTLSIREVYYAFEKLLGPKNPLIRQLYWHDFYMQVAYFSPYVFGHAYRQKYDDLSWNINKEDFERWCTGTTGFPIVDAGMRQLNKTGFMHNRARLIVASFLVKDLHINWLWGERYFAQKLVDYDPMVNNGNWQWSASTGCDAQPYFRIFNPWLQQKKFDPECLYIKRWVEELSDIPINRIHNWYKNNQTAILNYRRPMVDHKKETIKAKAMFQRAAVQ